MAQFDRISSVTIISKGQSITITDLRIEANIHKTEKPDSNTCFINIYNLSASTRNRIDNDDAFLIYEAGYRQGAGRETIYRGDITEVNYLKRKPETITRIEVRDGFKSIRNKKIALTYESGVTTQRILQDAVNALGLPVKNIPTLTGTNNQVFNQGYNFAGLASDLLDNITDDTNTIWNVQNNETKVYDRDGSDNSFIVVLNPASGMINSPEEIKINRGKGRAAQSGYRVQSLLQPLIEPGGRVRIESQVIPSAVYKVISVRHNVDNIDGDNITTTEVIQ